MHGQLQIEFANVLSLAAAGSGDAGLDKGVKKNQFNQSNAWSHFMLLFSAGFLMLKTRPCPLHLLRRTL